MFDQVNRSVNLQADPTERRHLVVYANLDQRQRDHCGSVNNPASQAVPSAIRIEAACSIKRGSIMTAETEYAHVGTSEIDAVLDANQLGTNFLLPLT